MIHKLILCVIILAACSSGCHSGDPVEVPPFSAPPTMAGSWTGGNPQYIELQFDLNQLRSKVTGRGNVRLLPGGAYVDTQIDGTCSYPTVSLSFVFEYYMPIYLTGTFRDTSTVTGELNGSGFSHYPIIISK